MRSEHNLADDLRRVIEEEIVTQQILPGSRLDEVGLAQRFNVSRTPVREALAQLASLGVVELRPRRGAVVREIGPDTLMEMFEVMGELEAMCGRLAARRMSDEEREKLLRAHEACMKAEDPDTYYSRNERFHHLIYAGSHNHFLEEQTTLLHRRLRPYRRLQLRVRDRMARSAEEHQAIVDAILAIEPERAAGALRSHIVVQGERFSDLIASLSRLRERRIAG